MSIQVNEEPSSGTDGLQGNWRSDLFEVEGAHHRGRPITSQCMWLLPTSTLELSDFTVGQAHRPIASKWFGQAKVYKRDRGTARKTWLNSFFSEFYQISCPAAARAATGGEARLSRLLKSGYEEPLPPQSLQSTMMWEETVFALLPCCDQYVTTTRQHNPRRRPPFSDRSPIRLAPTIPPSGCMHASNTLPRKVLRMKKTACCCLEVTSAVGPQPGLLRCGISHNGSHIIIRVNACCTQVGWYR